MKKISILLLLIFINIHIYPQKSIKLADIFKDNLFVEKTIEGLTSTKDGNHYTFISNETLIVKYNYLTNEKVSVLFNLNEHKEIRNIDGYWLSNKEDKLLIYTNKEKVYRHSFIAHYYVWNIIKKKLTIVSDDKLQMAELSPNGKALAYVKNNNLFIFEVENNIHKQITFDGEFEKIINGIPDWVYEEEFSYNKAFEWLAEGRFIAYKKFNESKVRNFNLIHYTSRKQTSSLYPKLSKFKYPKAGENNASVSLHIYDTLSKTTQDYNFGKDIYIPRIIPTKNPNQLLVLKLNRRQDTMQYFVVNALSNTIENIYTEVEEQYIDENNFDHIEIVDRDNSFFFLSEKDGFNHIYLFDGNTRKVSQITKGKYDVTDFYGYNKQGKSVFYQAATKNPMQREIFSKNIYANTSIKLSKKEGFNEAKFNNNCSFFINYHSTLNQPTVITLYDADGTEMRVLETNKSLADRLNAINLPSKSFITLPSTQKNIKLNAWILKPSDFNENKSYPLLITQYSGPNSQKVLDKWQFDWVYFLAQQGYIVLCIDPRGTGARGEKFRKATYLQLGKLETQDIIAVAQYFSNKNYIDKKNIAIWGWSYGGFVASSCLFSSHLFNIAIAVAPVTNWRYYDTIYTERFMRKPSENPKGYDNNSPINMTDGFTNGNLLLVHGTIDDNVHLQNTLLLSEKLVQSNKQFSMHLYLDKNHSIYGGNTRLHLFTMFYRFLEKNMN